jgi:hypothetical protein
VPLDQQNGFVAVGRATDDDEAPAAVEDLLAE